MNRCDSCLSRYPQESEYGACGKTLNNQRKEDETKGQGQDFVVAARSAGSASASASDSAPRNPAQTSAARQDQGQRSLLASVTKVTITARTSITTATRSSKGPPARRTWARRTCRPTSRKTTLDRAKPSGP